VALDSRFSLGMSVSSADPHSTNYFTFINHLVIDAITKITLWSWELLKSRTVVQQLHPPSSIHNLRTPHDVVRGDLPNIGY
jgi:hypothetical protein